LEAENNQLLNKYVKAAEGRSAGLRLIGAIWIGKILIFLTRRLGRGGTTLPGRTALLIAPTLSFQLAGRLKQGSIVVTGTNGKTTTASLIKGILDKAGLKCIHNQSGSNMAWGVASTLIENCSWNGKMDSDIAVMEVDEGAFPGVTASLQPCGIVVTNIFRDQLDRFGEIDSIQALIKKGLDASPAGNFQIINADDPSLASLKSSKKTNRWTYGLELDLPPDDFQNTGRDIKTCPTCAHKLEYAKIYFAHIGHYHCPNCSYSRPEPDVKLTDRRVTGKGTNQIEVTLPDQKMDLEVPLLGIYNLYNVLAAIACARAFKISTRIICEALNNAAPSFGRMERFEKDRKEMIMALIKNPVGANEILRTILNHPGKITLVVAINDRIADGTDVSWLWDVDFEQLAAIKDRFSSVIATGLRAWDMAVRFKYAGFEAEQLQVEDDFARAVELGLEQTAPENKLFILPTYTAMLDIRRHLNNMGLGIPFWEEH